MTTQTKGAALAGDTPSKKLQIDRVKIPQPSRHRKRITRKAVQAELALIALELAKYDRAKRITHSEADIASIRGAIKTINQVAPRERKLSTIKPQRDNAHATDCALRRSLRGGDQ